MLRFWGWPDFDYFRPAYIITQSYGKVNYIGQSVGANVTEWVLRRGWGCYGMLDNRCYENGAKVQFLGGECNNGKNITNQ